MYKVKISLDLLRVKLWYKFNFIGNFWVPPGPLFQNEGRFSAFDMEIIFH